MKDLVKLLELSAKKHGPDKVLTIGHLLNLTKLALKHKRKDDEAEEKRLDELAATFYLEELNG